MNSLSEKNNLWGIFMNDSSAAIKLMDEETHVSSSCYHVLNKDVRNACLMEKSCLFLSSKRKF